MTLFQKNSAHSYDPAGPMYRVRVLVNSRSRILPSLEDLLDMVEAVGKDAL